MAPFDMFDGCKMASHLRENRVVCVCVYLIGGAD